MKTKITYIVFQNNVQHLSVLSRLTVSNFAPIIFCHKYLSLHSEKQEYQHFIILVQIKTRRYITSVKETQ